MHAAIRLQNVVTSGSYFWISLLLVFFVMRSKLVRSFFSKSIVEKRRVLLPFVFTVVLFASFIFVCGLTHLAMALTTDPNSSVLYSRMLSLCTAISVLTAIMSTFVFPLIVRATDKLELTDEGRLKHIQNRLIDVIESCQESIIILSPEYKILSANKSTAQIFGQDCSAETITDFIHESDKLIFQDGVHRLHSMHQDDSLQMSDTARQVLLEYRVMCPRLNEYIWIESTLTLRESEQAKTTHDRNNVPPPPVRDLSVTSPSSSERTGPVFKSAQTLCTPRRVARVSAYKSISESTFSTESCDLIMLSRDITYRKREEGLRLQEEQARAKEQENQAKLQYITSCAHDLKTPLQSFEFAIELLRQTTLRSDQRDIVEQARISSALMALTISQTTDISRALMGIRLTPKKKTIQISDIITHVAVVIESYTREVRIHFHLPLRIKNRIISDEEWLWQMMLNYLTNASKFTESGSIDVYLNCLSALDDQHPVKRQQASSKTVGSGPDMLLFEVIDTGVGVSESKIPHLFKVFGQAQEGQLTGTGMGLYGVKIRCEGLNGKCGIYNRVDAPGSVFWFMIPYVVDDSKYSDTDSLPRPGDGHSESVANASLYERFKHRFPLTQESSGEMIMEVPVVRGGVDILTRTQTAHTNSLLTNEVALSTPRPKLSVFVVDDSVSIRKLMNRTLLKMDFDSVELFENGSKGLQAMKEKLVDIVFMDIQMPVMSGPEAVSRLRQFEVESGRKKRQLVVAVSANFTLEDQHNLVSMSMFDAIVPKPMHAAEIELIVRDYNAGKLPLSGPP